MRSCHKTNSNNQKFDKRDVLALIWAYLGVVVITIAQIMGWIDKYWTEITITGFSALTLMIAAFVYGGMNGKYDWMDDCT